MSGDLVPKSAADIDAEYRKWKVRYSQPYRTACTPDQEWQRGYLEGLRVKWRYHVTDTRVMQNLGNFGRRFVPWMAAVRLRWK